VPWHDYERQADPEEAKAVDEAIEEAEAAEKSERERIEELAAMSRRRTDYPDLSNEEFAKHKTRITEAKQLAKNAAGKAPRNGAEPMSETSMEAPPKSFASRGASAGRRRNRG